MEGEDALFWVLKNDGIFVGREGASFGLTWRGH